MRYRLDLPFGASLALGALIMAAGCSGGDDGGATGPRAAGAAPSDANAAPAYRDIHDRIDPALADQLAGIDDTVPPDVATELELTEPIIAELIDATRLKHCDFGITLDEGLRTELEHLSETRTLARMLRVDALRLADLGDPAGAAERLAAIIRLSTHASQGDFLITKLVAMANVTLATDAIDELIEHKAIGNAGRAVIAGALAGLETDDPFDARAAVAGEFDMLAHSLRNGLVDTRLTGGPVPDDRREAAAEELARLGGAFQEAWNDPDPEAAINAVEMSVDDDLVRSLMPSIVGFRGQFDRTQAAIAAAATALEDSSW